MENNVVEYPAAGKVIRVLQVEDSQSDAELNLRQLRKAGYLVYGERVEDATAMRRSLAGGEWDIVIADYQLPQFDAPDALRIRNEVAPDLPLIVVSGTIGEDRAVEIIRLGAQDYILKDRIARLAAAVRREVEERNARRKHRQVEERLRDRDQWLALAVGATQLGTFDFYPQSGRMTLSEAAYKHVGAPAGSYLSLKRVFRALHPGDRHRVGRLFLQAMKAGHGEHFTADYRIIGIADGVERWVSGQGRVYFDAENKPLRFVGVTNDISPRKRLEERLTLLDRTKSDFLNLLSHEFRTPLNGVIGIGDLLLEEMPATRKSENLREAFHTCRRRIMSIIDDASLLAKIDADGDDFKCSPVWLHGALVKAVGLATKFADSRDVTLMAPPIVNEFIWANEELLVTALKALLETGVKFSEKDTCVRMGCSASGNNVKVEIDSCGRAIPEHYVAKFFEIFSIGEAITPGGDLGLGAPLACRILALFGASVSISNNDSKSIKLTISLSRN